MEAYSSLMKQSIICSASHSIVAENPVLQQLEYGNVPRDQSNAYPEAICCKALISHATHIYQA